MVTPNSISRESDLSGGEYKWGFVTEVEQDFAPKGLSEDIVRLISAKKDEPEWLLEWRLKAYHHWVKMAKEQGEPEWAKIRYPQIDYNDIYYYAAPKSSTEAPKSLADVDPEMLATFEKLGIPLQEREKLAGVAIDAVFDSVSVATTYTKQLEKLGIIFCSFSEAVKNHPDLIKKYLGSVVPYSDNFFATLNSAVFSDGSFAYIPPGVRCPIELMTYFRMNAEGTGQFERTLIVADKGVCELPGGVHCAVPEDQPVACRCCGTGDTRRRRDQVLHHPELVPRKQGRRGRRLQLRHEAWDLPRRQLKNLMDAGRDWLCDHLEVPERNSPGR